MASEARDAEADVTSILEGLTAGPEALDADRLMPEVYDELRRMARGLLRRERANHTLQATALVNEAYLKLVDQDRVRWQGKQHFFALGGRWMRRILVDHARSRRSLKRGGDQLQITLDPEMDPLSRPALDLDEILALDEALNRLADLDEREARVVELRFFGGLGVAEVASVLGVSVRTVEADWTHARSWLHLQLKETSPPS